MTDNKDFENKAIEYYTTVLEKRRKYYLDNQEASKTHSRLHHQKIYANPETKQAYLAKRRLLYNMKKEEKLQKILDDKVFQAIELINTINNKLDKINH